jgi:hypothetical protein
LPARFETSETVSAWFIGPSPELDDISPARSIHEGRLQEAIGAARAFNELKLLGAIRNLLGGSVEIPIIANYAYFRAAWLWYATCRNILCASLTGTEAEEGVKR